MCGQTEPASVQPTKTEQKILNLERELMKAIRTRGGSFPESDYLRRFQSLRCDEPDEPDCPNGAGH
ncbi:MAG: hypothetical protein WKF90_02900 [Pyrinomonadaceae bacterium]